MALLQTDIMHLAEFGRRLAQAPVGAQVVAALHETLQSIAPIGEVQLVFSETPGAWTEWVAGAGAVAERKHPELPLPKSNGTAAFFDRRKETTGFVWIDTQDVRAVEVLELIAPQVWTALMLRAALHRKPTQVESNARREALIARDDERRHIARELHDDLGQSMTSLNLSLKWAEDLISANGPTNEAVSELASARKLVYTMFGKIRDLSHALYPRVLDTLGLTAAVKELLEQISKYSSIKSVCSTNGKEMKLPRDVALTLYRCCQEAVHNAVRHSCASRVCVQISFSDRAVQLSVKDDGEGLDSEKTGLWTIRQRVADLGGTLELSSAGEEGTLLSIVVPTRNA